ncbi:MAG: flagellar assembly protein FliW [Angelakisella sp.]|jgi:flagellar assembly factor FliW|nr:flagellar assembly protein FliW [Angelakisella sp.]MCI9667629.1 flagellar assembly protein FliW [Angelakisella sp.]
MKLFTRDLGEIEIDEKDIVTFTGPIFGFEKYRRFVFLYQEEIVENFIWLQSVEEPELCFILVQPDLITDHYQPQLPKEAKTLLGDGDWMCWLIVSLREPFQDSTVNLRSPIVVNPELRQAAQFVLEGNLPIRHPLVREGEKKC